MENAGSLFDFSNCTELAVINESVCLFLNCVDLITLELNRNFGPGELAEKYWKQKNEIKSLKNQLDTLRSIAKEKDEQVKQQNEKLKQQGQVIVNIATFSVLQDDLQNTLSQVTYDITQYTTEQENAASAARQAVTEIAQALSCLDTSCLTLYFQRVRDQLDIYDKSKANGEIILVSIEKSVSDFSKAKEALENFLLQTQSQRN